MALIASSRVNIAQPMLYKKTPNGREIHNPKIQYLQN